VLSNVIWNRLAEYTENIIGYYQNEFRTKMGRIVNVHALRQTIGQACEYNIQMDIFFIDFMQALIVFIYTK